MPAPNSSMTVSAADACATSPTIQIAHTECHQIEDVANTKSDKNSTATNIQVS